MILTKISPSRSPGSCWLVFEDKHFLFFNLDDVVRYHLKSRQTPPDYPLLEQLSLYHLLLNYALRQIALSPKPQKLISQKLHQKAIFYQKKYKFSTSPDISQTISQLILFLNSRKLLDDNQFVAYFVKKHSRKSRLYIQLALRKLGIDSSLIASLPPEDETALIALVQKKIPLNYLSLDRKLQLRLLSSFVRKGFAYNKVKLAIDDYLQNR